MRRIITLVGVLLAPLAIVCAAVGNNNARFQNASLGTMLQFYSDLTGLELVVAPGATNQVSKVALDLTAPMTRAQAAEKICEALREQAGLVIMPLDAKRASVKRASK